MRRLWILLLAAPKPVLELVRMRRFGRTGHSDPDQLARLTDFVHERSRR